MRVYRDSSYIFCQYLPDHISYHGKAFLRGVEKTGPADRQKWRDTDVLLQGPAWRDGQSDYSGKDPLICPNGEHPLVFAGYFSGDWHQLQVIFKKAGCDPSIPEIVLPGG